MSSAEKTFEGKKVAWLVPLVKPGSGGLQTVFRHVSYLQTLGAECHVIACFFETSDNAQYMGRILRESYQCVPDKIIDTGASDEEYDVAIATLNDTFPYLFALNAKEHAYFVQDYEPYFYDVGNDYIDAQNTYRDDVSIITIGRWLVHKLEESHGVKARHTNFGADRTLYQPLGIERERAVCAIFQPDKSRRCPDMVAETFELIHLLDPSVKLIAYGSNEEYPFDVPVENRGLVSKEECNQLYNECMVGLCISATNPSRIPFEMMASGLPVVDVYRDNTLWDFVSDATTLAAPNAAALASAILMLLDDPDRQKRFSEAGLKFMESHSGQVEQEDFAEALLHIIEGRDDDDLSVTELYEAPILDASEEVRELYTAMKNKRALQALTPPAPTTSARYVQVEIRNPSEDDIAAGMHIIASTECDSIPHLEFYEAFRTSEGSFAAQLDTCDFPQRTGLYRLRICRKELGNAPEYKVDELSVRIVDAGDADAGSESAGEEYARREDRVLALSFGDIPLMKNVKTIAKYVINPETMRDIKNKVARFR